MKFDQVRREFKRTLWGEELDYERYNSPVRDSLDLGFLHQYEGRKYQCINCSRVFGENGIHITNQGNYCSKCFNILIASDRPGS